MIGIKYLQNTGSEQEDEYEANKSLMAAWLQK